MPLLLSLDYLEEIGICEWPNVQVPPRAAAAQAPAAAAASAAAAPAAAAPAAAASDAASGAAPTKGGAGKKEKAKADKAKPAAAAAAPAPAGPPPAELSAEELAKLSKEERKAYHQARIAAQQASGAAVQAAPSKQLSKAERRQIQEAQRKAKEDKQQASTENEELLKELRLQGLSEQQAREVMAEMAKTDALDDDDEDDEPEDLLGSVRKWMAEQPEGEASKDSLHDFNMKVRFQGHVDTTPPDHLRCILRVLVEEATSGTDWAAPKLQPSEVAKKATKHVKRWAPLLEPMYSKIGDSLEAADIVVRAVDEGIAAAGSVPDAGRACGLVGSLMALREIDMIEDEDLLAGCRRFEHKSRVLDKFIQFLEEAIAEEEEDGSDEED